MVVCRPHSYLEWWLTLFSVQPRNSWHRYVSETAQNLSLYIFDPFSSFELQVLWRSWSHNQQVLSTRGWFARLRIEPTPKFILLESWSLIFSSSNWRITILTWRLQLSTKHGIGLFRSLYTLLRCCLLGNCTKRLRRKTISGIHRNGHLRIELPCAHLESS